MLIKEENQSVNTPAIVGALVVPAVAGEDDGEGHYSVVDESRDLIRLLEEAVVEGDLPALVALSPSPRHAGEVLIEFHG